MIIPSFFKKLTGGLLNSRDRISLLSVLAPGNTETEGNLKEEELGTHGSKEQAEERFQAMSVFKTFFKRHLFFRNAQFPSLAQKVHRVSHFDCPWIFQSKILSEDG